MPGSRQSVAYPALLFRAQFFGNGDVLNYTDWTDHLSNHGVDTCLVGRGALIKVNFPHPTTCITGSVLPSYAVGLYSLGSVPKSRSSATGIFPHLSALIC